MGHVCMGCHQRPRFLKDPGQPQDIAPLFMPSKFVKFPLVVYHPNKILTEIF